MTKLSGWKQPVLFLLLFAAMAIVSPAQTFTTLVQFNYTDGAFPQEMSLIQSTNGDFYGTTYVGGKYHGGTIFKVTPTGTLTTLRSFFGPNGVHPWAGLIQTADGTFYGTTEGNFGGKTPMTWAGSVFSLTSGGTLTSLFTFCIPTCAVGSEPHGGLVQDSSGNFYGTTTRGGTNNFGTVFEITAEGTLNTLYSFCGCNDGTLPFSGLVLATDGNFYGTTYGGGSKGDGTVFQITPGGTLTTLYSFSRAVGANPYGNLIQGIDGNFYGTTYLGGTKGGGTVFEITAGGTLTTLYNFCAQTGCTDGANPYAGLVQGSDGNFYGTTYGGGANDAGTIFEVTPGGTETTLYSFCAQAGCADGAYPRGGLVQGTDGNFYGTTLNGGIKVDCTLCGTNGEGTIFSLSVGLGPSVKTLPIAAK